eukprot:gene23835-28904_t
MQVAAADSSDKVARRGEELYKKRVSNELELEDPALIKTLFALFLGNNGSSVPAEAQTAPPSLPLKVRMMGLFCKSILAANSFPMTLQAIFDCLYGKTTNMSLKNAGMGFAVWVFKHSSDAQLKPMGPIILQGLLKLLDETAAAAADGDQNMRALRSFTYQAIGQLATRMPSLFSGSTEVAERFFSALTTEPQGGQLPRVWLRAA